MDSLVRVKRNKLLTRSTKEVEFWVLTMLDSATFFYSFVFARATQRNESERKHGINNTYRSCNI